MDNYYFHMDNLSVGYNRKALIHDICIGIKKGEIVTLIGPNGSGKSTILKSITRQLQIIGGKVYFDNQNLLSFTFRDLSTRMAVVLTSVMDSARGCFLHARSARNQILLFWMSLLHSWILNISWIFYLFFGIWRRKSR